MVINSIIFIHLILEMLYTKYSNYWSFSFQEIKNVICYGIRRCSTNDDGQRQVVIGQISDAGDLNMTILPQTKEG